MRKALTWFWKKGILSTFLAGLFALLPIVITLGIMAWAGGLLQEWLGPQSFVGQALSQLGLRFVTNSTVASILAWISVVLSIWMLGVLLKSVGKKRIEKTFHGVIERIPLVNILYKPVAQVVEMLQRDPHDNLQGMTVVYCAFGHEGGTGILGLLVSDQHYSFNGQTCKVVYVPTSPVPMSGAVIFAAAESVQQVDMKVDELMKIYFSIGALSSKVIPDQYLVSQADVDPAEDRPSSTRPAKSTAHTPKEKAHG